MKNILTLVLLLTSLSVLAQDYQCIQPGVKHYFTNTDGYIRGIRIDSVRTSGDSTIYYPYHTPRGRYLSNPVLDANGGSWLGKKVINRADGAFIFDNMWQDTVVIKTQANVGDSWVFYKDTTALYYQADMLAKDTMTVLGTVDSVKEIMITAHNTMGIVTIDPVDSFVIIISKNHGFAKVFDLYTFPYHTLDSVFHSGLDFYLDYVVYSPITASATWSKAIFSLIDLPDPTYAQLYQWQVGDVYEYARCNGYFEYTWAVCLPAEEYEMDTIISVDSAAGVKNYQYSGWKAELNASFLDPLPAGTSGYYLYSPSSGVISCGTTPVVDTLLMPEEYNQTSIYFYEPGDTSECTTNSIYKVIRNDYLIGIEYTNPFESDEKPTYYKAPLGLLSSYNSSISGYININSQSLLFYNRSGITCGTSTFPDSATSIAIIKENTTLVLSPNPVVTELAIKANTTINKITITNYIGQTVYEATPNTAQMEVNLASMPPGVYVVKINGAIERKFVKE